MKRGFENLLVWQKSVDLSVDIYTITRKFPKEELFGLTSQLRRAAVSVASNIAEGASRASRKEFIQFLSIARGSNAEIKTQIIISYRIGLIEEELFINLSQKIDEVGSLISRLKKGVSQPQQP